MNTKAADQGQAASPTEARIEKFIDRRNVLLGTSSLVAAVTLSSGAFAQTQKTTPSAAAPSTSERTPNIVVIWGDDIGISRY